MTYITHSRLSKSVDTFREVWYKFSKNRLSIVGLLIVLIITILAAFAPYIAPYPAHAGRFVNFPEASQPPGSRHLFDRCERKRHPI